jgi:hypothetical protein
VPQQPHPTSSSAFPLRASLEGFDNHSEVPSTSSNGGIGKDSIYILGLLIFCQSGFEPGSRVNFVPLRESLEGFDNHFEVPSTSSNAGGIGKDSIYNQVYNFGVC